MIAVQDNRPTDITVNEDDEVVVRYNWTDDSTLDHAAEIIQQRLIEMGEDSSVAIGLANQVKKL